MVLKISYLPQADIDKEKWDQCIDRASNGSVYGYSYYLDAMSSQWDALVFNDYEIVMPLTWKKKYGIRYLYQPFFTASLGIFGNHLSSKIVNDFLQAIPRHFRYWDFYLNRDNFFVLPPFPLYERHNFILPLHDSYETLESRYAKSHSRNVKRSLAYGNRVQTDIDVREIVALAREQFQHFSRVKDEDLQHFITLFELLKKKKMAITYGVLSPAQRLVASCVYFFSHNRAFYILVGNHPEGRTSGASHFMIDQFIKDYAGKNLILDFEGSNIPSLARFYRSFGAHVEKYPGIRLNRLPPLLRLFRQ